MRLFFSAFFLTNLYSGCWAQTPEINKNISQYSLQTEIPKDIKVLRHFYPQIIDFARGRLFMKSGDSILYDDQKSKSHSELLNFPDIQDQMAQPYLPNSFDTPSRNFDPGRYRNEVFFKAIYGNSPKEVERNLVEIIWCPKMVGQRIKITKINGLDSIVRALSAELDQHPEFKKYISNIGGTYLWRRIAGTNRLSMHSFGATIDINVAHSHYWQWDCKCSNEQHKQHYKNKIPFELVKIFEKYGFIWGGKWYHYDSMHFEYRPELIFYQTIN